MIEHEGTSITETAPDANDTAGWFCVSHTCSWNRMLCTVDANMAKSRKILSLGGYATAASISTTIASVTMLATARA